MQTHSDAVPVRLVIWFVGATLILSLGISAYLIYIGKPVTEMTPITLSCITGLLALLSNTRTAQRQGDAVPVPVITPPNKPLETVNVDDGAQDDVQSDKTQSAESKNNESKDDE